MREVTSFRLCHLDGIGAKDVSIMDARPCKKRLQALLQQEFNVPDGCVDVIFATGREARIHHWAHVPRAIFAWLEVVVEWSSADADTMHLCFSKVILTLCPASPHGILNRNPTEHGSAGPRSSNSW